MSELKTLPGFLLTIEDNAETTETQVAASDVITIYAIMPDTFKYGDEDGDIYDKYIEPNKPMLIVSKDEALKTLELSGINITREVKNIITLAPSDANIALCKIVKRDGENPDKNNLIEMYEALDFAFEETENYPVRQVVLADISFDKSLANKPNEKTINYSEDSNIVFDKTSILNIIGEVHKQDTDYVDKNIYFDLGIELKRDENSKEQLNGIGIYSDIIFKINGETAKCITNLEDGTEAEMIFKIDTTYNPEAEEGEPKYTINSLTSPTSNPANKIAAIGDTLQLTLGENFILKIDEENVLELKQGIIEINSLGQSETGDENITTAEILVGKNSAECHILLRTLKFVHTITRTKNNCMLFMSPEPPRNQSNKAKTEYINKAKNLYQEFVNIRNQVIDGSKVDLGMYLTVVLGSNRTQDIGGLTGFPQSTIKSIDKSTIITTKPTTYFSVGDSVEVYTYDKLDILTLSATVTEVKTNTEGTTTITLSKEVTENILNSKIPKYIMNVNDKDFNGNYMAMQWTNVCIQAGVDRSPEGIGWEGECQLAFSAKELDSLNVLKYAVLDQITGTTQGAVSRSQLMTGSGSQFQDIENLVTVYALTKGAKTIGDKYKGTRFDETTDLALVRTELEDSVFTPAVGRYITSGYDLKLFLKDLKEDATGKKIRALFIDFTVTEIKTLKALRIIARVK